MAQLRLPILFTRLGALDAGSRHGALSERLVGGDLERQSHSLRD